MLQVRGALLCIFGPSISRRVSPPLPCVPIFLPLPPTHLLLERLLLGQKKNRFGIGTPEDRDILNLQPYNTKYIQRKTYHGYPLIRWTAETCSVWSSPHSSTTIEIFVYSGMPINFIDIKNRFTLQGTDMFPRHLSNYLHPKARNERKKKYSSYKFDIDVIASF